MPRRHSVIKKGKRIFMEKREGKGNRRKREMKGDNSLLVLVKREHLDNERIWVLHRFPKQAYLVNEFK